MESIQIEQLFPNVQRVQISLLRDKYNIPECDLEEVKKFWIFDTDTGYYCKPSGVYDPTH